MQIEWGIGQGQAIRHHTMLPFFHQWIVIRHHSQFRLIGLIDWMLNKFILWNGPNRDRLPEFHKQIIHHQYCRTDNNNTKGNE